MSCLENVFGTFWWSNMGFDEIISTYKATRITDQSIMFLITEQEVD